MQNMKSCRNFFLNFKGSAQMKSFRSFFSNFKGSANMKSCREFCSNVQDRVSARPRGDRAGDKRKIDGDSMVLVKSPRAKKVPCPHAPRKEPLSLETLPQELFEKISAHLTYENVAEMRLVSRKMNALSSEALNSGFYKLQTSADKLYKITHPAKLPLFSAIHDTPPPLKWKAELFEKVSKKLDRLLQLLGEHIDKKHCCFFAGALLDEFYRSLWCITVAKSASECFMALADLDKLCRKAKEHFVEYLRPYLPSVLADTEGISPSTYSLNSGGLHSNRNTSVYPGRLVRLSSNTVLKSQNRKLVAECQAANRQLAQIRREVRDCRSRLAGQQKLLAYYEKRVVDNKSRYEKTSRKLRGDLNKYKTQLQTYRQSKVYAGSEVADFRDGLRVGEGASTSDGGKMWKDLKKGRASSPAGSSTSDGGKMWKDLKKRRESSPAGSVGGDWARE